MSGNGLKGYKFVRGHELIMLKILLLLGSLCLKKITWFKVSFGFNPIIGLLARMIKGMNLNFIDNRVFLNSMDFLSDPKHQMK